MAIDRLQADPFRGAAETRLTRKSRGGPSGFETVLGARLGADKGTPASPRQSAAELLRMEMMLNSLALAGDTETAEPSSSQAMHTLLASLLQGAPSRRLAHNCADGGGVDQPEGVRRCADAAGAAGIEATAAQYLGTPYRFGGEGEDGIDCSSFVQRVYLEHRVELPRTAREQIQVGREVAREDLRKGDLVFFQTYASYPSHVGIYLGDGKMIHASSEKGEVTISDMNSDYYLSRYLGAKRVA